MKGVLPSSNRYFLFCDNFNDIIEAKVFDLDLVNNFDELYEILPMFSNPKAITEIKAWFIAQQKE